MRQLLFATSKVTSGAVSSVETEGAIGIAIINPQTGEMTFINDKPIGKEKENPYLNGTKISGGFAMGQHHLNLVLVRAPQNGGNVVIPLYPNHYDAVKAEYQAATTFEAGLTVPAPDSEYYDYTIIAVKKGKKFNERNKWTASVRVKSTDTAATLAQKLADYFNANKDGLGLEVTVSGADLTFDAIRAGEDYEIVPADDLMGVEVTYNTRGKEAFGDAKYIKDLADKAAADVGYEYTYQDDLDVLYPYYHFNPLAQGDSADAGFNIYTLRFAEPRMVKTRDEVVHQIVQIVCPSDVNLDSILINVPES